MVTAVTVRGTHRRQGTPAPHDDRGPRRGEGGRPRAGGPDRLGRPRSTAGSATAWPPSSAASRSTPGRASACATACRHRWRSPTAKSCWNWPRKCSNASTGHTPGSIVAAGGLPAASSGLLGRDGSEDEAIRCALHYDAAGTVDGYVSYKFAGWDTKPYTMEIVDLVAATGRRVPGTVAVPRQHRPRGSDQLAGRAGGRPPDLGAGGPRCIESSDHRDMLWLRILDTGRGPGCPALLRGRITRARGRGRPRLRRRHVRPRRSAAGRPHVATAPAGSEPDLSLDVADLGSIYLGAVCPVTLKAAGRITEHAPGAALTGAAHVRRRTLAALPDAFLTAFRQVTGLQGTPRALTGVGDYD